MVVENVTFETMNMYGWMNSEGAYLCGDGDVGTSGVFGLCGGGRWWVDLASSGKAESDHSHLVAVGY